MEPRIRRSAWSLRGRAVIASLVGGCVAVAAFGASTIAAQSTRGATGPVALSSSLVPTIHPPLPDRLSRYWLVPDAREASAIQNATLLMGFARGVALIDDGKYSEGLPFVSRTELADTPVRHYAALYRAIALFGVNRAQEARVTLESLFARRPEGFAGELTTLRLADVRVADGQPASAVDLLDTLLADRTVTRPEEIRVRLGRAAQAAGDRARAIAVYRSIYYDSPTSEEVSDIESTLRTIDTATLEDRLPLELGRAERLFAAKRYPAARAIYDVVRPVASSADRELIALRLAECDYYAKRYRAAREALESLVDSPTRGAEARYFLASAVKALGDRDDFAARVMSLAREAPSSPWTAEALNALAQSLVVADDDAAADEAYRELVRLFPTHRYSDRAAWKIGWWAYKNERYADAVEAFERGAATFPRSDLRPSWLYWSARAREEIGDRAGAEARYRLVVTDYQNSYYGRLATRRLGDAVEVGSIRNVVFVAAPSTGPLPTESVVRHLIALGLFDLATSELRFAQVRWSPSPAIDATLAWIRRMQAESGPSTSRFDNLRGAINLMKRAYPQYLAAGGTDLPAEVLGVIYPLDYWPLIQKYAAEYNLDPYLMAALIAQESTFTADVRSGANALGLMQLLPATGRRFAAKAGYGRFSRSLLTQAEPNIRMGMAYFKMLIDTMDGVPYALASYNAGERRVSQWKAAARPGIPEDEFIDDIPFPETQNYVKRIMGTADDYRRLYGDGLLTPIGSRNLVLASTGAGVPAGARPAPTRSATPRRTEPTGVR